MDTQIWYAIFSTIYGGFIGACDRLGEVILSLFNNYYFISFINLSKWLIIDAIYAHIFFSNLY